MATIGDAIQNIFTKGLDAAQAVAIEKLRVNDPSGYVTGPNGTRVPTGQPAGFAGALNAVPPIVWIGAIGILGAVLLLPLLRR